MANCLPFSLSRQPLALLCPKVFRPCPSKPIASLLAPTYLCTCALALPSGSAPKVWRKVLAEQGRKTSFVIICVTISCFIPGRASMRFRIRLRATMHGNRYPDRKIKKPQFLLNCGFTILTLLFYVSDSDVSKFCPVVSSVIMMG